MLIVLHVGLEPEYECDACVIPPSSELVAQRPEDSMSVTILNEAFYLEQICEDIQGQLVLSPNTSLETTEEIVGV